MGFRDKIGAMRGDIPVDDATLDVFLELLEVQHRLKGSYSSTLQRVDARAAKAAIASGRPAASAVGVWLTEEEIAQGVREIAEPLIAGLPGEAERVRGVLEAVGGGRLKLKPVAEMMLRGDLEGAEAAAEEAGVDPTALSSLVAWALQPAFAALSQAISPLELGDWGSGRCPVCGSYAALGYFDRGGVFHLKCQFCGTEWEYPSGKCPFCGNDDPDLVSVIEVAEGKPLALGICHVCGSYWKIVDERRASGEVPRDLYDLWTLALDVVARRILR
jgi:FdhE protein